MRFFVIGGLVAVLASCITLDGMLPFHNNVHCSEVTTETCGGEPDPWDQICRRCDQDYDWAAEYPWREKSLDTLSAIRAVDSAIVVDADFKTDDGLATLDAYFIPSHGEVPELAGTTIVYNHGQFAGIEHYLPRIRLLHELGFAVFVWDYRGYGKSTPNETPTTAQWMADARQALEEARGLSTDGARLIVYGFSLGGIPAGEMADVGPACAHIFEAAFVSVREQLKSNMSLGLPGSHLTAGEMENDIKLADTIRPTLIMQGTEDTRFRRETAQHLYDALPDDVPKSLVFIEGAGHGIGGEGGVPEAGFGAYREHIMTFLNEKAPACMSLP